MGMEPIITDEVIARQPPEAQAIIRDLLAKIAELEAEVRELRGQVKGKTPQNSSLPPSTQHPHAKPQRKKRKSKRRRGGQPGHPKHERPLIPTEQCDDVEPLKPTECRRCGREALGQRPGAVAASGVGIARDQAAGDRVSTASARLPGLRRDDVCATARRRAAGSVGAAADGLHRPVDGLLSSKQAADGGVS